MERKKRKKTRQVSRKGIAEIFWERSCNNKVKVQERNLSMIREQKKKKYSNKIKNNIKRNIIWILKKASYTYRNEKRIKGIRK